MKKIIGVVAVLTVLNVFLLLATRRTPASTELATAPQVTAEKTAPIAAPTARALEAAATGAPKEVPVAKAAPTTEGMEPGEETASADRVKQRQDEERRLKEIRERTAAAMAATRGGR